MTICAIIVLVFVLLNGTINSTSINKTEAEIAPVPGAVGSRLGLGLGLLASLYLREALISSMPLSVSIVATFDRVHVLILDVFSSCSNYIGRSRR